MNGGPSPEIVEAQRQRLVDFVYRARRVREHSLAADLDRLRSWAQGTYHIEINDDGGRMRIDLPPEEAFESLASRCRPFILSGDPVHHDLVMGSLKLFIKGDPELVEHHGLVKGWWSRHRNAAAPLGFRLSAADEDGEFGESVSSVDLAEAWL